MIGPDEGAVRPAAAHTRSDERTARIHTPLPRLHVVTNGPTLDRLLMEDGGVHPDVHAVCEAGGHRLALHLRAPGWSGRSLWHAGRALGRVAQSLGCRFVVNDRVDVALALAPGVPVFGVQLGSRSLPPSSVRTLWQDEAGQRPALAFVGRSVHATHPMQLDAGPEELAGADALMVGTLYSSLSHPGRPGAGPAAVAADPAEADPGDSPSSWTGPAWPRIGIGGITPLRVAEVMAAGAWGVAVLSGVWSAEDPARATLAYLTALEAASTTESFPPNPEASGP